MRFPPTLELELIRSLVDHPDDCITFPPEAYENGHIRIYRDGLSHRLVRWLYERLTGYPAPPYLLRVCKTPGCQNFTHHLGSAKPYITRLACPNGHPYEGNQIAGKRYRCRRCREAYNRKRRKGTGARPGYCAKGHRLTDDNVYIWLDADSRPHRRCRKCTKTYQRNYRKDHAA